jgi:hypothetical protein
MTGRAAGFRNWAVSLAATATSTYALDACASAAGIYLVASGLLADFSRPCVTAFVVVTYALWGLGLRASVQMNWKLLATRGISTNVLSKAAYDVSRRRTRNPRVLRLAAAAGYIGAEVAKEAPYYTAAFGAAAFSSSITSTEALIFLGGTNLGAALYEYGLARLTRAVLHRVGAGRPDSTRPGCRRIAASATTPPNRTRSPHLRSEPTPRTVRPRARYPAGHTTHHRVHRTRPI